MSVPAEIHASIANFVADLISKWANVGGCLLRVFPTRDAGYSILVGSPVSVCSMACFGAFADFAVFAGYPSHFSSITVDSNIVANVFLFGFIGKFAIKGGAAEIRATYFRF